MKPWITYKAINWLENYLNNNIIMFEWGSGNSTLYFAGKVKKIISVEHDVKWYDTVYIQLRENVDLRKWDYYFVPAERLKEKTEYFCGSYTSKSGIGNSKKLYFEKYVKFIDAYHDGFFDFVFIDGRSRPSCVLHAINKIKRGGYLMLDNSNRKHYQCMSPLLKNYEKKDFYGHGDNPGKWTTTVWRITNEKSSK